MMSPSPVSGWDRPRCLIQSDRDGTVSINSDTVASLQEITDPVVVVGIVGLYRTGKSYLMNRLAGNQSGFALGSTIQSKTKGIWIWCVPHPKRNNCCLLLLDTEGLGDVEKGDPDHDVKIFTLAVLLTSTLVYNSLGTIDQNAIDKLHFVSSLADHVKIKANTGAIEDEDSSNFEKVFPSFVWAVRDFMLDLEICGKPVTEDEYLENALKFKKGVGKKIYDFNLPRECIKAYFPSRKCMVFSKPVDDTTQLRRLDEVREDELNPEFCEQTQRFLSFILDNTREKTIAGRSINGRAFARLAQSYVEAIRNGAIPCLEDAVKTMAKLENERAISESVQLYKGLVLESVQLPTNTIQDLSSVHLTSVRQASEHFLKLAIFDTDNKYYCQMTDDIEKCYNVICRQNEEASTHRCSDLLKSLFQPIGEAMSIGVFTCPGGYDRYKSSIDDLVSKYKNAPQKGVMAEEVLRDFLKRQEENSAFVLKADETLNNEAKKLAEERQRAELAEKEKLAAEEILEKSKLLEADRQKCAEEHLERLKKQAQEEETRWREEQNQLVDKKLKEQETLLRDGFKDRSEQMKKEIDDLRSAVQQPKESSGLSDFLGHPVVTTACSILGLALLIL